MLKRIASLAEKLTTPMAWTSANVVVGLVLIARFSHDPSHSSTWSFASGWFFSSLVAYLPSMFFSSWWSGSKNFVKPDRGLAYIEGWKQCGKYYQNYFKKLEEHGSAIADANYAQSSGEAFFLDGLNSVEAGKHLSNS